LRWCVRKNLFRRRSEPPQVAATMHCRDAFCFVLGEEMKKKNKQIEREREVLVVICCIELWMWIYIYIKVCRWGLKI
jgi:hypothetical protein